jgi:hypothetical protein
MSRPLSSSHALNAEIGGENIKLCQIIKSITSSNILFRNDPDTQLRFEGERLSKIRSVAISRL